MQEQSEDQFRAAARAHALQVAIDGPAASGKSTIARRLAQELQCAFLDTGLMYRALTDLALKNKVPLDREDSLLRLVNATSFHTTQAVDDSILVNGELMGPGLRVPAIDAVVSVVSAMPQVRSALVQRQREMAGGACIIMVGRDIGTVVLPRADVKLWVTASADARARRRFDEKLTLMGETVENVRAKIEARDSSDSSRAHSPLTRPADAMDVCTDGMTVAESVLQALGIVREVVERMSASGSVIDKP